MRRLMIATKKPSKTQLLESIIYWQRQLDTLDAIEKLFPLLESADSTTRQIVQQVKDDIKTPTDVKEFVQDNDAKVQSTGNAVLKKMWNWLKAGIGNSLSFAIHHWKVTICIIILVYLLTAGVTGFTPAQVAALMAVTGNTPELDPGIQKSVDRFNNLPAWDDGTMGSF